MDLLRNSFKNIFRGCFSIFFFFEILIILNNEKLGLVNLYNVVYGFNKINIKEFYVNNIN